jgi:hypothetical protein
MGKSQSSIELKRPTEVEIDEEEDHSLPDEKQVHLPLADQHTQEENLETRKHFDQEESFDRRKNSGLKEIFESKSHLAIEKTFHLNRDTDKNLRTRIQIFSR